MKNSVFLLVFLFLASSININSQVQQQWVARYNGPANSHDYARDIAVDPNGNIIVAGYSYGVGTSTDFCVIKYNSSGTVQWLNRYNGPSNSVEECNAITVDNLGNVYVTGWTLSGAAGSNICTIKYNSGGVQQWVQFYSGPANRDDHGNAIVVDANGNVYVTGSEIKQGAGGYYFQDYCTIKYDAGGSFQWVRNYNGPLNQSDEARAIGLDGAGNIYVTGYSQNSAPSRGYATIKYNPSGTQLWLMRYDGPYNLGREANAIAVSQSGDVYVTGSAAAPINIKYNTNGMQQWASGTNYVGNAIKIDAGGNVYVTGYKYVSGSFNWDIVTAKYNSGGTEQWLQIYSGSGGDDDKAYDLVLDNSLNIYVTGFMHPNIYIPDYITIKYNPSGIQQWAQTYGYNASSSDDAAYSIVLDTLNNVYVTGTSYQNNYDYATIKYSQLVGIHPISNEIPKQFSLSQNYPNPFNPTTKIRFQIPKSGFVNMIVYDILGREMATLVNEELSPGTYEADWDAANYPSGVYFYRIKTNEAVEVRKMVLAK